MKPSSTQSSVSLKRVPFKLLGTIKVRFLPAVQMKPRKLTLSILALLFIACPAVAGDPGDVTLCFSPRNGCESHIIEAIDKATLDINVAAYSFSSKPIAKALYRATKRNVIVRILLDKSQVTAHYSMANDLQINGLTVRIDKREAIMHMKTMQIDGQLTILGSYNFTASANTRNAEIVAFIVSQEITAKANKNWFKHWSHSLPHELRHKPTPKQELLTAKLDCVNGKCSTMPSTTTTPIYLRRLRRWSN